MDPIATTGTFKASTQEAPWYSKYPVARTENPASITREEVLKMMNSREEYDFILIDLRRTDHDGGAIRGSINVPAQSLYTSIPTLYAVFKAAGRRKVIWFCVSSRGRGTRAAAWFNDYIENRGDGDMQSLVLLEGIKGWATAGPDYTQQMDEYEEAVWKKA